MADDHSTSEQDLSADTILARVGGQPVTDEDLEQLAEQSGIPVYDEALDPHQGEGERWPAAKLVELLKAHRVVDATSDGEGNDDVRLLLDNNQVVVIDPALELDEESQLTARAFGRPVPWPRLYVKVAPRAELWPFNDQDAYPAGV
jgi:hypothetical protein